MRFRHLVLISGLGIAWAMMRRPTGAAGSRARTGRTGTGGDAAYDRDVARDIPKGAWSQVRPSGPESQRDRPSAWDAVDEGSDESFPASDSPAY